jgi:ABC-type antimicrobial peptide transport system permease subunit
MYEQYSVILASLVLGTIVGFILSSVVTAQFFLFMEFPFSLDFPYGLLYTMVIMSIVTTFYAVWVPVSEVNNQKIAQAIKGNA